MRPADRWATRLIGAAAVLAGVAIASALIGPPAGETPLGAPVQASPTQLAAAADAATATATVERQAIAAPPSPGTSAPTLEVRLIEQQSGRPAPDRVVDLASVGAPRTAVTDRDGRATFAALAVDAVRITTGSVERHVALRAGHNEIVIAVVPATAIAGRVVDAAGHGVVAAEVCAVDGARTRVLTCSDPDGAFALAAVAGDAEIFARKAGQVPSECLRVGSLLPADAPITLALGSHPATATIAVLAGGQPAADVAVCLRRPRILSCGEHGWSSPLHELRSRTDARGEVTFADLDGGRWQVLALASATAASAAATLDVDAAVRCVLELGSPARVHGSVVDRDGRPVAHARIGWRGAAVHPELRDATADAAGKFALPLPSVAAGDELTTDPLLLLASHDEVGTGDALVMPRGTSRALTVVLERQPSRGALQFAGEGWPADAVLLRQDGEHLREVAVEADGRFALLADDDRDIACSVWRTGFDLALASFTVRAGQPAPRVTIDGRAASAHGVVTCNGAPARGWVGLYDSGVGQTAFYRLDERGQFRTGRLRAGSYRALLQPATSGVSLALSAPIALTTTDVGLGVLSFHGEVWGQVDVAVASVMPQSGWRLLTRQGDTPIHDTLLRRQQRVRFDAPPGTVVIDLIDPTGRRAVRRTVEVRSGNTEFINL